MREKPPIPLAVQRNSDGSATYVTQAGDRVSHICWRHYGYYWDTPEAVLNANHGLAALGPSLPAGVSILLPHIAQQPARKARRRLFD